MTRSFGIVTVTCEICQLHVEIEVYPGYSERDITDQLEAWGWSTEDGDICPDSQGHEGYDDEEEEGN